MAIRHLLGFGHLLDLYSSSYAHLRPQVAVPYAGALSGRERRSIPKMMKLGTVFGASTTIGKWLLVNGYGWGSAAALCRRNWYKTRHFYWGEPKKESRNVRRKVFDFTILD